MAAGVTDRFWEISDIVALVEVAEAKSESAAHTKRRSVKAGHWIVVAVTLAALAYALNRGVYVGSS